MQNIAIRFATIAINANSCLRNNNTTFDGITGLDVIGV